MIFSIKSNIKILCLLALLVILTVSFSTLASSMDAIYQYKENSKWSFFLFLMLIKIQ